MYKVILDTMGGDNSPYAQVEGAVIAVNKDKDFYVIEIIDNGVGFDTAILNNESSSLAIKNIKERIGIIDSASFEISSVVGEGSKCIIRIPSTLPSSLSSFVKKEGE